MSPWLFPSIAVVVAAIAAFTDLRSGRIPNVLTFSAILTGLVGHGIGQGIAGAVEAFVAMLICAAVPGIVYKASRGRGIGGGDIKLFAALGALLGPTQGLEVELSSFMLLGLFAMFQLAYRGQLRRMLAGSLRVLVGFFVPSARRAAENDEVVMTTMRMGPAIAVAVVTVMCLPYVMRWLPWLG